MSILYAISIVYIAGEYDGPGFCTPIGITSKKDDPIEKPNKTHRNWGCRRVGHIYY